MSNHILGPEQVLKQDSSLWSEKGLYELRMQDDGNLVLYRATTPFQRAGAHPEWDAWTSPLLPTWTTPDHPKQNVVLKMQGDGNLVIYEVERPLWESDTFLGEGTNQRYLDVQDDGNLVIYQGSPLDSQNQPIWSRREGKISS